MALVPGAKLGPYEILSPIGAGGMGEVYRARDERLDRTVAIKILPDHLSATPQAKQRFDREARTISSLNHPSICTLHDVGHQNGIDYLVMEYLEGETLAERLRKGPLPVEQIYRYGVEISDGLDKAHRIGVAHRDLKPGNIMLTKSGAKLMDFGLAKAWVASTDAASGLTTTLSASYPLTAQGTVLGTFPYMSPEQVEGKEADARSDIFALGAVLYEMATGKRAFEGKTAASAMAAVLAGAPKPVSTIQPAVPAGLEHVIETCLAKDPDSRWQSCADVARQLKWLSKEPKDAKLPARNGKFRWAALGLVMAAIAFLLGTRWADVPPRVIQFQVNAPPKTNFNFRGLSGPPIVSPDGSKIAFVAFSGGRSPNLWMRAFESSEARLLPGTEGASFPFWSPDGRFLAFFANGKLKKLDLTSGNIIPLCDASDGRGGTWSTQGVILFGTRVGLLFRVDASGGNPVQVTTSDPPVYSHRWPQFLPDQRHFLLVAQSNGVPMARLGVASLDSPKPTILEDITSNGMFSNNHLFYVQDNTLLVRGFDTGRLRLTGEPVVLAEQVQDDPQFNYASFSVSGSTLVYQSVPIVSGARLIWYDRNGKETVLDEEQELVQTLALSPKEDQLAVSLGVASGKHSDIWLFDVHKNIKTRLTFNQNSSAPAWSPDGRRVAFHRIGADGDAILAKDVLGNGSEEVLLKLPSQAEDGNITTKQKVYEPLAWTPDGKYLIYVKGGEVNALPFEGQRKPVPLLRGVSDPVVSPDGRWLAYSSDESGVREVYVVPFRMAPDGSPSVLGGKWQVSNVGGMRPTWRGDGKEIYFTNNAMDKLMSVDVKITGDHFESDRPRILFDLPTHPVTNFYAVTRDGQKIYMTTYGAGSTDPITVTTNWMGLLRK